MRGFVHPSQRDYTKQLGSRVIDPKFAAALREAMDRHGIGHDHPVLAVFVDLLLLRDEIDALLNRQSENIAAIARDAKAVTLAMRELQTQIVKLHAMSGEVTKCAAAIEDLRRSYSFIATFVAGMSFFMGIIVLKIIWTFFFP